MRGSARLHRRVAAVALVAGVSLALACSSGGSTTEAPETTTPPPSSSWTEVDLTTLGEVASITAIAGHRNGLVVAGVDGDGSSYLRFTADLATWADLESDISLVTVTALAEVPLVGDAAELAETNMIGVGNWGGVGDPAVAAPGAMSVPGLLPVDWTWDYLPAGNDRATVKDVVGLGDGSVLAVGEEGEFDEDQVPVTWQYSPATDAWLRERIDRFEGGFDVVVDDGAELLAFGRGRGADTIVRVWAFDGDWSARPTPAAFDGSDWYRDAVTLPGPAPADLVVVGQRFELDPDEPDRTMMWIRVDGEWRAVWSATPRGPAEQETPLTGITLLDDRLVVIGETYAVDGSGDRTPLMWVLEDDLETWLSDA